MTRSFLNCFIVLTLLWCSSLGAASANLAGTVVDAQGAVIEGAHIVIRADSSGRREAAKTNDIVLKTDARGRFSASLPSGFYDVCVMADAFTPRSKKVLLSATPLNVRTELAADPEVMRRLGDRF